MLNNNVQTEINKVVPSFQFLPVETTLNNYCWFVNTEQRKQQ